MIWEGDILLDKPGVYLISNNSRPYHVYVGMSQDCCRRMYSHIANLNFLIPGCDRPASAHWNKRMAQHVEDGDKFSARILRYCDTREEAVHYEKLWIAHYCDSMPYLENIYNTQLFAFCHEIDDYRMFTNKNKLIKHNNKTPNYYKRPTND